MDKEKTTKIKTINDVCNRLILRELKGIYGCYDNYAVLGQCELSETAIDEAMVLEMVVKHINELRNEMIKEVGNEKQDEA